MVKKKYYVTNLGPLSDLNTDHNTKIIDKYFYRRLAFEEDTEDAQLSRNQF